MIDVSHQFHWFMSEPIISILIFKASKPYLLGKLTQHGFSIVVWCSTELNWHEEIFIINGDTDVLRTTETSIKKKRKIHRFQKWKNVVFLIILFCLLMFQNRQKCYSRFTFNHFTWGKVRMPVRRKRFQRMEESENSLVGGKDNKRTWFRKLEDFDWRCI